MVINHFAGSDAELEKEIAAEKKTGNLDKVEQLLHLRIQNLIGFIDALSR